MTVVDKHACSSPVIIKLGAFCVADDVVVDRFNFLGWDVHNKVIVYYKRSSYCPNPICINDHIKDLSIASKFTSVIDHRHLDPICLKSQSAPFLLIPSQSLTRFPGSTRLLDAKSFLQTQWESRQKFSKNLKS